ncbi:putative capsular polysaccharide synthesis family protein [Winogradskyella tangerina]|uniref:putative capsular polysaccharide synthesis family protein n=1 Tax=Winogradskyella tangerina TaxID=2023240 RepID=UPI0018E500CA|nr:putative capsular polysaccharide synthesis family protein [Winogradskyella tangerina]
MNKKLKDKLRNSWLRAVGFFLQDILNYLKYNILKKDLVLIYQMGKVASSSIYYSLKEKNLIVYHVHRLNKKYIQEVHESIYKKTGEVESKVVDKRGIRLFNMFIKSNKRPVYVISMVRNPIERNISAFFQNKEHYTRLVNYSNTEELIDLFYNIYDHETPLLWFDKEFNQSLNTDIYETAFPKEKKYQILKSNNYNILLLRVDLEDQAKEKIIKEFLGLKQFELKNKNVGAQKNYYSEYKEFKQNIKLEKGYIDKMLNSKFVKFFYTENEIMSFEKEWSRN